MDTLTEFSFMDTVKRAHAFESNGHTPEQGDMDKIHDFLAQNPSYQNVTAQALAAKYPTSRPLLPRKPRRRAANTETEQSPLQRAKQFANERMRGKIGTPTTGGLAGLKKAEANAKRQKS